jgi:VanZ family protein
MPWISRRSCGRFSNPSLSLALKDGWALRNRAAGLALVSTLLLAAADELHQRYVPQRTSTMTDVGFDVCGGYFALMILFAALRIKEQWITSQLPAEELEHALG